MDGGVDLGAGIDEGQIRALIPAFYDRVRADAMLGPLFNVAVHDWPEHLENLIRFWSSVMRGTGRYKGSPMRAHHAHAHAMTPAMFDRWLALWRETTNELLPEGAALAMQAKADRIAESLQLGLFFRLPRAAMRPDATLVANGKHDDLDAA